MKTFPEMDAAFKAAEALAIGRGGLWCVMARDARGEPFPWGVCSDAQATTEVNCAWSPWSHWANVRAKTFRVEFTGRVLGAIGIFCRYYETVTAADKEKAVLALYDRFEHIRVIKIEEVNQA